MEMISLAFFSQIGTLAREPVRDAKGHGKGFPDEWPFAVKLYKPGKEGGDACVQYVDKCAAKAAIKAYNGHFLKGTSIKVEYAGVDSNYAARSEEKRKNDLIEKDR